VSATNLLPTPINILVKIYRSFLIVFLIALSGCNAFSPTPATNFEPIQPDPSLTPPEAVNSPGVPTSVVPTQVVIQQYAHSSNRFQVDYPAHWQYFEQPNGVQMVEPDGQAGYSVIFNEVDRQYTPDALNQYLSAFIDQNFAEKETDFSLISQESRPDGSATARFSSLDPNLGPTMTQIQVNQHGSILFVTMVSATQEQWQLAADSLQWLANSLRPLDVTAADPTDEPPEWILIGPTGNTFAFLYPSDWQIAAQTETAVTVEMADYPVSFTGELLAADSSAEDMAEQFIADLTEKHSSVESLTPTDFPLDTTTGATIDFLYSANGEEMAGSVITAVQNGQAYRVIFTAPAELYQPSLEWFNPMYKSFKMLPPEN